MKLIEAENLRNVYENDDDFDNISLSGLFCGLEKNSN